MKENKFRGISQYTGEFVYGQLLRVGNNFNIVKEFTNINDINLIPIIKGSQEQSTGFKDKVGVEIYCSDKIRIYNDELDEDDSWCEDISYHMGGFFAGDDNLLGNVHFRCKVINNK